MPNKPATDKPFVWNLESGICNHAVYAGSFAALEARWIETVAALRRDDALLEINVLVGSNILASYLKRRFAATGRALANVRFHTFLDLASRLSRPAGGPANKIPLPRLGPSIFLDEILSSRPHRAFEPVSGLPGFRDALLDTFRDLRDAGISAEDLTRFVDADAASASRRRSLSDLAGLYREFRARTGAFHDVDDDFRAAVRNAPSASRVLQSPQLLVYGIYDATGQQLRLLAALKNIFSMVYFVPYAEESVCEFARPFLQARCAELGVEPIRLGETVPETRSLHRLAARGFGLGKGPHPEDGESLEPDGSIALVSAPGESRAAVEIIREVFRAVRDGTIRGFHEAAVILRQPENDVPVLREAFRLRGVPYFVHGGARFAERPCSRAVVALGKLEPNGCSHEAVLAVMELVAASLPETSVPEWDVQAWRALTNDARFLAGFGSWDRGTRALVDEARRKLERAEAAASADADEDEERRGESVPAAARRLQSAIRLREAWELLRQAASGWPSKLAWEDWADALERSLEPLLGASEDWSAFSAVLDEIRSLGTLGASGNMDSKSEIRNEDDRPGGARPVSADDFRSALVRSIEAFSCPEGRFQRSGVNFLSTSAARGLRFPLVILPGLDEGRFPAKLRQDPLLFDAERVRLGNLPLKSRRLEEERLLFDMACRSAEKRLVLMTSRLDEGSDRERIPSQFFLRAAAAVRGSLATMRDLTEGTIPGFRSVNLDNPAPPGDAVAVDEGEIRLRLITADPASAARALRALERIEPLRLKGPLAYDQARWARQMTPYDGCFADPALVRWLASRLGASAGQVSASRMEECAKCPYHFYLNRGMGLERWEEPAPAQGMDPLERGVTVHAILEGFMKEYCGRNLQAVPETELRRSVASRGREALEKSRPAGIPDLLWEIERDTILGLLDEWIVYEKERAGEDLSPAGLEQAFGNIAPGENHPAFRLAAGRHTFDFRGRIDRVDLSGDGKRARVIDYKTGSLPDTMTRKTRTPLMSGERIQIAVYRGALSALEAFQNVEEVEGEYLHLQPRDGRVARCFFSAGELREAARNLPEILAILGDGIENGRFFARTAGTVWPGGHCSYCDYLPICGKDRTQREERKAADPAVRKFLGILETDQ